MIKSLRIGKITGKYPENVKKFALNLSFYSKAAYNYVRNVLNIDMPSESTLKSWYKVVNGNPGITTESIETIKLKVKQSLEKGKALYFNLCLDEVYIRKRLEVDVCNDKYYGFVDFGDEVRDENASVAKEALVYMLTAVNDYFKMPVAYFLTNGVCGTKKAMLTKEIIYALYEIGANVICVTFDGAASNKTMATKLGACLLPDSLKTYFNLDGISHQIFISIDNCHAIKLQRNHFFKKKIFYDEKEKKIDSSFITKLVNLQEKKGLSLAPKINRQHIDYSTQKMKVKLAVQVFSLSVADALDYLRKSGYQDFKESEATAVYLRKMNNLFDIFNSRNKNAIEFFKRPFCSKTCMLFLKELNESRKYIMALKDQFNEKNIVDTNWSTGFIGFVVNIDTFTSIYNQYITTNKISFLLTYKFSQDHIEIFFSSVRMMGGWNNNPTARQFISAYKKLLVNKAIRISGNTNCMVRDNTSMLPIECSLNRINGTNYKTSPLESMSEEIFNFEDKYIVDITSYIGGFVQRKLLENLECECCKEALKKIKLTHWI